MPIDPNRPFEYRDGERRRVNAFGVKPHRFTARTLLTGTGEAVIDIPFPVHYVEPPGFSYGYELQDNVAIIDGEFPTISAVVVRWTKVQKKGENVGFFYRAATVAVVLGGSDSLSGYLHTHFEGKALRNPLSSNQGGGF